MFFQKLPNRNIVIAYRNIVALSFCKPLRAFQRTNATAQLRRDFAKRLPNRNIVIAYRNIVALSFCKPLRAFQRTNANAQLRRDFAKRLPNRNIRGLVAVGCVWLRVVASSRAKKAGAQHTISPHACCCPFGA